MLNKGITCIYLNSIDKIEKFGEYKINSLVINKIQKEQKQFISKENIKKIKIQLYFLRKKYGWKYEILNYIENGYCYLHSNLPKQIKRKIIEFIDIGYIRLLFVSPIILNGISLPIDNMVIDSHKINNKNMIKQDFNNLIARCGRTSKLNAFNIGFVFVKSENEK